MRTSWPAAPLPPRLVACTPPLGLYVHEQRCRELTRALGLPTQSLPAPGVPCATVDRSNPGYATCDPNYVAVPNYYNLMKAGNLNLNVLGADTSGTCDFLEDAFEETFTAPTLNTTRWLASELDGQEHCLGLPPAGNTTCTMMMSSMIKLNAALPANAGGGNGAILTLSQTPCVGNACCNAKGTICAKWAGAHLVSAGCIQYGVLEVEAAFNMPANSGAFYFTCVPPRILAAIACARLSRLF